MSTVVLTLVVVAGSVVAAGWVAHRGERQPATEVRPTTRARGGRPRDPGDATTRPRSSTATVDRVDAVPSAWVRLRGLAGFTLLVSVVAVGVALTILGGVVLVSRALEGAVN